MTIQRLSGILALAFTAAFFGITLYINLAEQPARLALPDAAMLTQWQISFGVGIKLQGAMTIIAGLLGLVTWYFNRSRLWLVGGLLMLANWPWTLVMIAPINDQLTAMNPAAINATARQLVEQWGGVHSVRTGISLVALATYGWALAKNQQAA